MEKMGLIGLQCKVVPEILVASRKISIEENITMNTAYDELYNYVMANHTCVDYCKAMLCNKNNTKLEYQYVEAVLFLRAALSGFIDLGRSGSADRWYDIAFCVRSISEYIGEEQYVELFFDLLGIKPDWEKIKYYILLDELF